MGLFERKRHRREDMAMVRRVVDDALGKPWYRFPPMVWEALVLVLLALALALICFWGRPPHLPVLLLGTESKVRYEAQFDFKYTSKHRQDQLREQARRRTTPVYRVAFEESVPIVETYRQFIVTVAENFDELKLLRREDRIKACLKLIVEGKLPGLPERISNDVARVVDLEPDKESFARVMKDALSVLEALLRNGVYERQGEMRLYSSRSAEVYTASRNLRDNLDSIASRELSIGREQSALAASLFDIFRPGLLPNVQMDDVETLRQQEAAMAKIKDVVVEVPAGSALTERGVKITPAELERWNAYRQEMALREKTEYGLNRAILENAVMAMGIVLLVALYTRVAVPVTPRKRRNISLTALMVLINLALIRFILDLGESPAILKVFSGSNLFSGGEVLFWMAPPALAAIIVAMLVGPHMAVLATFLVSTFSAMMLGRSVDVLFISIIASLIGIYCSREARNRSAVVRAGVFSGVAVTVPVFVICATSGMTWLGLFWQVVGCLASGLLTGMFAVGILPLLEHLFKTTTNITLLELTDYNRPLLRKLQFIAPGTFHHSVMVANLAEHAAAEIDANALLCRCAALYHDVGKMVKPEYFIENQRMGANPHAEINPTMSALVIKSHVREGVEIAKEYGLPRVIIDIIEQHHGTGLIQFFYHKARQKAASNARPVPCAGGDTVAAGVPLDERSVDETVFRYDGPRPRSKEAAVVLFADSLEAASRALKKVTPQSIKELVDSIIADRIMDGQLDQCPLTFREVQKIRESLKASLLNMLHHRVEYPKASTAPVMGVENTEGSPAVALDAGTTFHEISPGK